MADIYEQHRAAFQNVAAWVIAKDGEKVATVAIKYPRDGAGRLYAYVHWLGTEMVRGHAGGFGYDKGSAAVSDTRSKLTSQYHASTANEEDKQSMINFICAACNDDGHYWYDRLQRAGFTVWQAV